MIFKHKMKKWPRGKQGDISKIKEEFLELEDAHKQNNFWFKFVEVSDLLYTLDTYCWKQFKIPFSVMCVFTAFRLVYKRFIRDQFGLHK